MRSASTEPSASGGSPWTPVVTATLASDVEIRLRALGPDLGDHDMLILPPYQRDGESLYDLADTDALRLARKAGMDADFLHQSQDRRYLQEYSAGTVINFAIALGANITSQGLTPVINYVVARIQQAIDRGLHSGPVEAVPVSLEIASYSKSPEGAIKLEGLKANGLLTDITRTLRVLVSPESSALETTRDGEPEPPPEN